MPAYLPDIVEALATVRGRLEGVGLEVATSTAEVNPPGVWLNFTGFADSVLSGETFVVVEAAVVVGAMPLEEAYAALVDLASEVVEELGHPDGPIRKQATTFGNDAVSLPTLVLPYNVAV